MNVFAKLIIRIIIIYTFLNALNWLFGSLIQKYNDGLKFRDEKLRELKVDKNRNRLPEESKP
jgi:hypothetical protein